MDAALYSLSMLSSGNVVARQEWYNKGNRHHIPLQGPMMATCCSWANGNSNVLSIIIIFRLITFLF